MKIILYDGDENAVIVETSNGNGFIAELDAKIRYPEKQLTSLVMDDSWSQEIPAGIQDPETIINWKIVN